MKLSRFLKSAIERFTDDSIRHLISLMFAALILARPRWPGGGDGAESPFRPRQPEQLDGAKLIAQSKGFFRAEGLETEMIQMNPRLAATALVERRGGLLTPSPASSRHSAGIPIKVVFVHQKRGTS
jgi:ABC-type nitrate/sulfonate/bicarbonate transport system substrate-binding protein